MRALSGSYIGRIETVAGCLQPPTSTCQFGCDIDGTCKPNNGGGPGSG